MTKEIRLQDFDSVEKGLKDFQRATVDYVFRRLYLDSDRTNRFLVADEVGLGKTLVARGVVARAIRHLWDTIDRIDVVYICSNHDIARQNVNRLNITGDEEFAVPTRITFLPLQISGLQGKKLNFVSLTPGTSFHLKSNMGVARERVLLYWLLKDAWGLEGVWPLNVFQGGVEDHRRFRESVKEFPDWHSIDPLLAEGFIATLEARAARSRAEGLPNLRARFDELREWFGRARKPWDYPQEAKSARREVLGQLRQTLAVACVNALEPDLVILDEFQRFKDLLIGDDPASALARELFEYSDHVAEARVLLLSATPYKMYTISDEMGDDHHYRDFLDTLRFLYHDESKAEAMDELLTDYRRGLFRLGGGDLGRLQELKCEIERRLRAVMVRTERLAVTADRSGMLTEVATRGMELRSSDVSGYLELQEVARRVGYGDTLPYWKSAPYLLSFMEGYQLKEKFERAAETDALAPALGQLLRSQNGLSLSFDVIRRYREVDPSNARLRALHRDVIDGGTWQLLWIPPSFPYYQPDGVFAQSGLQDVTKRLVFSAWRVVPKVVASLLSYEAERQAMRSFEKEPENSAEARKRRRPLLRFTMSDERLTGMPVLGIMYPSLVLADACDPLELVRDLNNGGEPDSGATPAKDVLDEAERRVAGLLAPILQAAPQDGPEDVAWYWAAPILLDLSQRPGPTRAWLGRPALASSWAGGGTEEQDDAGRWGDHVERATGILNGSTALGRPPGDLSRVVALMGLAGPAVTSLRALSRLVSPSVPDSVECRDASAQMAWAFRRLFNLPEAMAIIRGMDASEPYWQRVLEYSLTGNLQAVLDEFVHVLRESLGFVADAPVDPIPLVRTLAEAVSDSLTLRTVSLAVDEVQARDDGSGVEIERARMRAHFALRFGDESGTEDQAGARAEQVRAAFNSPFWPFVLVTTSVGQEGLDFHTYCHAVVHWNLPHNPVDLEQREGRVHRYKGHAVRKNLALRHATEVLAQSGQSDPWAELFAAGEATREPGESELIPFWVYQTENGAKIERHVPALPLSREQSRLVALRRSLAVYRMVFGQPRQEDLVAFLLNSFSREEIDKISEELRIDLGPPAVREVSERESAPR